MNQVACPHCGMVLIDDGSLAGQSVTCPHCSGLFLMPASQAVVTPPPMYVPPAGADAPPPLFQKMTISSPETSQVTAPPFVAGSGLESAGAGQSSYAERATPNEGTSEPNQSRVVMHVLAIGFVITAVVLVVLSMGKGSGRPAKQPSLARTKSADYWIRQLQASRSEADRRKAAEAIAELDSETLVAALAAVTSVTSGGKSYVVDKGAMTCLVAVGPKLGDSLPQALRAKSENVRIGAAHILREMGPKAIGAREALENALDDGSRWVRRLATTALGNLGSDAAPSVGKLIQLLDHEDAYTRRDAAQALGQIGPAARAAVPALEKLLEQDEILTVRKAAEQALAQVDREGDALERAAKDKEPEVSEAAQAALKQMQGK